MNKKRLAKIAGVTLVGVASDVAVAAGIPALVGPEGANVASAPPGVATSYAGWIVAFLAFGLMAFMFVTAMKNAWQIYHQLGEEGSKKTWRDLGANVAVGVLLVCLGAYMATKATAIFGQTSL